MVRMIEQKTLFSLFEKWERQNDKDGYVVGVAGGPVYHASPTLLLMCQWKNPYSSIWMWFY